MHVHDYMQMKTRNRGRYEYADEGTWLCARARRPTRSTDSLRRNFIGGKEATVHKRLADAGTRTPATLP